MKEPTEAEALEDRHLGRGEDEMTLEKAIDILNDESGLGDKYDEDELCEAIKLGIEALKKIKDIRAWHTIPEIYPLPGETDF